MRSRFFILITSALLLVATQRDACAQADPSPDLQREKMAALDFLRGQWEGDGWIALGGDDRQEFQQTETVTSKLGGLLVMVEGTGVTKGADPNEPNHQALGLLSYDPKTERYRFFAHTAEGRMTDATATVGANQLQWSFESPYGTIRYTIRLTEEGEWLEIGEGSRDGQTWRQFFEMRLRRKG